MDYIDIIGTLYDHSIDHTSAIAEQVKDLRLNKYLQDINEEVLNQLESLHSDKLEIDDRIESLRREFEEKLSHIKVEDDKHIFLTQRLYDALTSYKRNVIYIILDMEEPNSTFGSTFPLTFGESSSYFGGVFPIKLK